MNLSKSEKLRIVLIFILLGFFFGDFDISSQYLLLGGLIFLILSFIWKNFWILIPSVLLLAMFYAQWHTNFSLKDDLLPTLHDQTITLNGHITSFPDIREKNNRAVVQVKYQDIDGKILLITSPNTVLNYGDRLEFTGKLKTPQNFQDFDYKSYLRRFGVQTIVQYPKQIEIVAKQVDGIFLLRWAEKARLKFAQNLEEALPVAHSKIAMGILLGIKNELPTPVQTSFKNSGLQHLLVVSGFNVTVVIIFIALLLRRFGRRAVFLGSILALIFFVSMTGAEAPVVRAALMGCIVGLSKTIGRSAETRNIVLLSAVTMGLWNPQTIQSDISFYLSIFATIGIVIGTPILEKHLTRIPEKFGLRTLLSVTIAAQLAVLPLLGIYFGTFNSIGFVSNLFAEPLIPFAMFFSSLIAFLGFLPVFVVKIIAIPAFVLLEILLQIAYFFGQITPFVISKTISYLLLAIVLGVFLWGNFSRKMED